MEIRINKEIKDYHESLFFGLSMRQCICSLGAIGTALGIYFGLKNIVGQEVVSWLCILGAAPLAMAGFFKYNGMNFEDFIKAFIYSEFLCSGIRKFESENYLYNMFKEVSENDRKAQKNTKTKKKNSQNGTAINSNR